MNQRAVWCWSSQFWHYSISQSGNTGILYWARRGLGELAKHPYYAYCPGFERKRLLNEFNIEIGAGLGPLAGKIWRVGLMGASSSPRLIVLLAAALERALAPAGRHAPA